MRVGVSCLYIHLDRLGGLESRIKTVLEALLRRGDSILLIQTPKAAAMSQTFASSSDRIETLLVGDPRGHQGLLGMKFHHWYEDLPAVLNGRIDLLDTWDPYLRTSGRDFALVHSSYYYLEYFFRHLNLHSIGGLRYPLIDSALLRMPILRQADALLVENSLQRDYLRAFAPGTLAKCHVVPPGFNGSMLSSLKGTVKTDPWQLLFIGRVEKLKGVDELLNAFSECSVKLPQLRLTIIGGGPELPHYVEMAKEMGLTEKVTFAGERPHDETLRTLAGSAAFVLPSHLEGFPNAILESMALGVPVISSDVGSVSRHMVRDGESGLLFRPWDSGGLARSIETLFMEKGLRDRLIERGEGVSSSYSIERLVSGTLDTYDAALEHFKAR